VEFGNEEAVDGTEQSESLLPVEGVGQTIDAYVAASPMAVGHMTAAVSPAFLASLATVGSAAPGLATAIRAAASSGRGLEVVFSPEVTRLLRSGQLNLLKTSTGQMATAVTPANVFVENARVVGDVTKVGAGAVGGAALGTAAVVAFPVMIAVAAGYAQQRQLDQALESMALALERIETRLKDADSGTCDAAEDFLELAQAAVRHGGVLPPYLELELAQHRTAVESLYRARKRYVDRFKRELERQQNDRERDKGDRHPWVDVVIDGVKDGELDGELLLFVRALVARTKLNIVAAAVLAEGGQGEAALGLIDRTERELRTSFFDLHRRLVPLARYAPEPSRLQRIPGLGKSLERTRATITMLVDQLNADVLPMIPDPDEDTAVRVQLGVGDVQRLRLAPTGE